MKFSLVFRLILTVTTFFGYFVRCEDRVKYVGYATHRFVPQTVEDQEMLKDIEENNPGVMFWRPTGKPGKPVDIMFPPHLKTDFLESLQNQMPSSMVHDDIEALIDHDSAMMGIEAMTEGEFDFNNYWDWAKVNEFCDTMGELHPARVKVQKYGVSTEGRKLRAFHISNNSPGNAGKKPVLMVDGGFHAREWITVSSCCYLANELITKGDTVEKYKKILDDYDVVMTCTVNPDGYHYTWTTNRLWRKTRSVNAGSNCRGVDPNRNFPFGFRGEGSSTKACSDVYAGETALSEPETHSLSVLMNEVKPVAYVSLHSYSEMILLPYGCNDEAHPDFNNFQDHMEMAQSAADAIKGTHGVEYTFGDSGEILYMACGTSEDWAKAKSTPQYAFTLELRDAGKYGFVLPPDQIQETCEETANGILAIFSEVRTRQLKLKEQQAEEAALEAAAEKAQL